MSQPKWIYRHFDKTFGGGKEGHQIAMALSGIKPIQLQKGDLVAWGNAASPTLFKVRESPGINDTFVHLDPFVAGYANLIAVADIPPKAIDHKFFEDHIRLVSRPK